MVNGNALVSCAKPVKQHERNKKFKQMKRFHDHNFQKWNPVSFTRKFCFSWYNVENYGRSSLIEK